MIRIQLIKIYSKNKTKKLYRIEITSNKKIKLNFDLRKKLLNLINNYL